MRINENSSPILDSIMEEYTRLKKAEELLKRVYIEIGAYPTITPKNCDSVGISHGTIWYMEGVWSNVRDYFGFDDSE